MAIAFSPDGQTIASAADDKTIKIWNLEGQLLYSFIAHAFTPDSKFLVSCGDDSTVILWDLEQISTLNELEYACD